MTSLRGVDRTGIPPAGDRSVALARRWVGPVLIGALGLGCTPAEPTPCSPGTSDCPVEPVARQRFDARPAVHADAAIPADGATATDVSSGDATAEDARTPAREDATTPAREDAGSDLDSGFARHRDASPPDGADGCNNLCADLDQNGRIDDADRARLEAIVIGGAVPDDCEQRVGDLKEDGRLTRADYNLLAATLRRRWPLTRLCEPCTRRCGDIDDDGDVDQTDYSVLVGELSRGGIDTGCEFWAADVTGNGVLDADDTLALLDAAGSAQVSCAP